MVRKELLSERDGNIFSREFPVNTIPFVRKELLSERDGNEITMLYSPPINNACQEGTSL